MIEPANCVRRNCLFVNNFGLTEWPGLFDLALEKAIDELPRNPTTNEPIAQTPDEIANVLAWNIDDQIVYNPGTTDPDEEHPLRAFTFQDGVQCAVNANLLRGLLRSIGVNNSETIYVWGGKPDRADQQETETGGTTYGYNTYYNSLSTGGRVGEFYVSMQAIRPESNEGPVQLPKDPHFTFHAMVKVFDIPDGGPNNLSARYYDPSYAKRLQANRTRYPDYPYINSNVKFKRAANLDDPNSRNHRWVEDDATKPFVVRALIYNSCLPNFGRVCGSETKIFRRSFPLGFVAAAPRFSVFDNQNVATFSVWRPSDGIWYTRNAVDNQNTYFTFGSSGDLPASADYDGDGKSDYAVFRPSDSTLYIWESNTQVIRTFVWNMSTDEPTVGDFDGDGKADIAFVRPSDGTGMKWFIARSSDGVKQTFTFGAQGDIPVTGDFDGDGKTDIAVFRPINGVWWWWKSTDGTWASQQFGLDGDVPTTGDYDLDGKTDLSVYRPSSGEWFILNSSDGSWTVHQMGGPADIPVPGDYDGDGKTDPALWTPSTSRWYAISSLDGIVIEDYWGSQSHGDIPIGSSLR